MNDENILGVLFRPKIVKLFLSIKKGSYPAEASKIADLTYSHGFKIICDLEKEKLLELKKEGRKQVIYLTEKGKELQKLFTQSKILLKGK